MVEVTKSKPVAAGRWRSPLVGALIVAVIAGIWALADVDAPDNAYPAMSLALRALVILFLATSGACAVIVVWDRLRQTGPEAEREISFEAFSDVGRGLVRPLLARLVVTLLMLQTLLIDFPGLLRLVDQQAWLKVLAAAPLMLLLAWAAFAPYPALIRDWRAHRAAAGI
ncbi:MAG: hypothetical protein WC068_07815 [Caulobacter sp.]